MTLCDFGLVVLLTSWSLTFGFAFFYTLFLAQWPSIAFLADGLWGFCCPRGDRASLRKGRLALPSIHRLRLRPPRLYQANRGASLCCWWNGASSWASTAERSALGPQISKGISCSGRGVCRPRMRAFRGSMRCIFSSSLLRTILMNEPMRKLKQKWNKPFPIVNQKNTYNKGHWSRIT